MKALIILTVVSVATANAYAESCVRLRDGADGYTCMTFSEAEREGAAELNLNLAASHQTVLTHMSGAGWKAQEESCGQGLDAVCQLQMTKGQAAVLLTFSAVNDGVPLIAVEKLQ